MMVFLFIYCCLISLLFFGAFGYGISRITGFTKRSWLHQITDTVFSVIFLSGGVASAYAAFHLYLESQQP